MTDPRPALSTPTPAEPHYCPFCGSDLPEPNAEIDRLRAELAVVRTENDDWRWTASGDGVRKLNDEIAELRAKHDALLKTLIAIGEEVIQAGYPGGDREVILENVRRMRALLSEVGKALKPFAAWADHYSTSAPDTHAIDGIPAMMGAPRRRLDLGHFRAARVAYTKIATEGSDG